MDISSKQAAFFCGENIITEPEAPHWHNETEIIFAESGYMRLRINKTAQTYDLYAGDIAVIRSCDMHKLHPINGKNSITVFRIPPSGMALFTGTVMTPDSYIIPADALMETGVLYSHLLSLKNFLKSEYCSENKEKEQLLTVCSSELCMLLIRMYDKRLLIQSQSEIRTKDNISLRVPGRTMEKFEQILAYTRDNVFDSKLSLWELSEKFGINSTYISELFLRFAGIGYKKYVITLRLNKAAELLCNTDKNISEIAYSCGFDTIRTFNKIFKNTVNMTPTDFRNEVLYRTSQPYLIKGGGTENSNSVFVSNVTLTEEKISEPGFSAKQYFKVECNDREHKIWTTISTSLHFTAGRTYAAHFYLRSPETKDKATIYINFRFLEKSVMRDHIKQAIPVKKVSDWTEYRAEYSVPKEYTPGIDDAFSVYANPYENKGISFDVTEIDLKIK